MSQQKISSVGFLRTLAQGFGGLDTVRGRGLHRAAAHMVKLQEEIDRLELLSSGSRGPERIEAAAQGIAAVVQREMGQGPSWLTLAEADQERFRRCAEAALGAPVNVPPADPEEMAGGSPSITAEEVARLQ